MCKGPEVGESRANLRFPKRACMTGVEAFRAVEAGEKRGQARPELSPKQREATKASLHQSWGS